MYFKILRWILLDGVSGILEDLLQSEDEGSSVCSSNKGQKNTGPSPSALQLNRLEMQKTDFCADLKEIFETQS